MIIKRIKIFLSIFFSALVAGSTALIAYLLDPAIEKIFIEKNGFDKNTIDSLNMIGHEVKKRSNIGHVNAIIISDKIETGADKRGDNLGLEFYVPTP